MILVFDIGVTKTRVGISRTGGRLGQVRIFPTHPKYAIGIKHLIRAGRELLGDGKPHIAVGGFAGPLNSAKRIPLDCQREDWIAHPLAADLERGWKCRVVLENDAVLNGLGEAVTGVGRGHRIVGFLTVSSGVNGVRIVDKMIDANVRGYELRWLYVPNGKGSVRPLGEIIAGRSITRRYGDPAKLLKNPVIRNTITRALAIGAVNLALAWSPDILVFGGSIVKSLRLAEVRRLFRHHWLMEKPGPKIVFGSLGDKSGLHGGLALAKSKKK